MREMDARFAAAAQERKALQQAMDKRFEALMREMDARFEALDYRFTSMTRQLAMMQWLFGVWLTLLSVLAGYIAFFK